MKITQSHRKRRSALEIKQLLLEKEVGGWTVRESCKVRGINEGNYFNWRKKYNAARQQTGNFITLQLEKGNESSFIVC